MNEPHIPNDERNWDSIDIFVFSNGQQYSPPRKYHFESDDLKWWDGAKSFVGRSLYGSTHSAIELYSLDGKKLEGPLELKNSAAYVAVQPPDSFIPAGYEKYLFKASRSWEKRHERLSNNYVVQRTDKSGTFLDITTIEQIEQIISLKSASSQADPNNIIDQPKQQAEVNVEKTNLSKLNSAKIDKLFQKKKSFDSERSKVLNKKRVSPSKLTRNDFLKTKNILKSQKCSNKPPVSPKYSRSQRKPTRENNVDHKVNPKRNNIKSWENNAKFPSNALTDTNVIKGNSDNVPDKDLTTTQVYNNTYSEDKSILLEVNPNKRTIDANSRKILNELNKDNEFNDTIIPNILQIEKTTSKYTNDEQIHQLPDNENKKLNIKLRIKLEDINPITSKDGNNLEKDKSIVALIKKEMASQVNIDVILGKDILTLNNYLFLNEKPDEAYISKQEEYIPSKDDGKEIFVHYMCDNFYPNLPNDSYRNNMILLPKDLSEHAIKRSCKCKKVEMINKGVQKSLSSSTHVGLKSAKVENGEGEKITEHKVSMLTEIPEESKSKSQYDLNSEVNTVERNVPLLNANVLDEKSTQTEWCNIVLQVKNFEDGRCTFHLPNLSLLKQYNMDR